MGLKHFINRNIVAPFRSGHLLRTLARMPGFFLQWSEYNRVASIPARWNDAYLCLDDASTATPFDAHYFYQSGWTARKIAQTLPARHVDVGSQINLIAPLSAFVHTDFVDIRPLEAKLSGLRCLKGSILSLPFAADSVESLSCLHVVEHIGLGRYGDPLDPDGTRKACAELQRVVAKKGHLFLSTPVGFERIEFNAHRIHLPSTIVHYCDQLGLQDFSFIDDDGNFHEHASPEPCAALTYGLGMFHFVKPQ